METELSCPFCGEPTAITVDEGEDGGEQSFIQDCDVCCHPIQVRAWLGRDGEVTVDCERA